MIGVARMSTSTDFNSVNRPMHKIVGLGAGCRVVGRGGVTPLVTIVIRAGSNPRSMRSERVLSETATTAVWRYTRGVSQPSSHSANHLSWRGNWRLNTSWWTWCTTNTVGTRLYSGAKNGMPFSQSMMTS